MTTESLIRILTLVSLGGLLFAVGLRLTLSQIVESLRRCRPAPLLLINFAGVPLLAAGLTRLFALDSERSAAMILLAAAPFAPVVPVFARMAHADLALAAALTTVFPLLCVGGTPAACLIGFHLTDEHAAIRFNATATLLTLSAAIALPVGAGVLLRRISPAAGRRLLRPIEVAAEAAGALALVFVTATEARAVLATGWRPLLAMAILSEASLFLGRLCARGTEPSRRVLALGTSNRNIALAILLALDNFSGGAVLPGVVANGILLIALGLVHVAYWRFVRPGKDPPVVYETVPSLPGTAE